MVKVLRGTLYKCKTNIEGRNDPSGPTEFSPTITIVSEEIAKLNLNILNALQNLKNLFNLLY